MKSRFVFIIFLYACVFLMSCNGDEANTITNNSHQQVKEKASDVKEPDFSTRKMIKRLATAVGKIDPEKVENYLSSKKLDRIDTQLLNGGGVQNFDLNFEKGNALLNIGKSLDAINIFESLQNQILTSNDHDAALRLYTLKKQLAISYMRLGEQENCLANHNDESCIIPISENAQHKIRKGSEKAIKLLDEILVMNPNDKDAQYVLNIAHMTLGTYPIGVAEKFRLPPSTFLNNSGLPTFKDVAGGLGVNVNELSGGTCIDDFNNDGYLDIIASSWGFHDQIRYFENDQKGGFVDKTKSTGLVGVYGGLNLRHADYDNDGDMDFIILRGAWLDSEGGLPNSLIKNNGDGTFTDATVFANIYSLKPTQTAVWADFDLDGWVDLFIANESSPNGINDCELFMNKQDGTFINKTKELGILSAGFYKGIAVGDINNDRYPDIYLSNFFGKNILYLNSGDAEKLRFDPLPESANISLPKFSFSTWMFDYNNDGLDDIFVSGYSTNERSPATLMMDYAKEDFNGNRPYLYKNIGGNRFKEVSLSSGLKEPATTMGCNIGDLNNDGYLDFYLATGNPNYYSIVPNKMYLNKGGRSFEDVTYSSGFGHIQKGHSVGFGDFDMDGDQDIYTVMGGALEGDVFSNLLFENPIGDENNWIHILLEGVHSNKSAIGAKIILTITENGKKRKIYHNVGYDASFGGNSLLAELGVGQAGIIDKLEVLWPSNKMNTTVLKNVDINQKISIVEGNNEITKLNIPKVQFAIKGMQRHH